jgi:aminopeptidase C
MSSLNKKLLREEAKRIYKKESKTVPKAQRITFSMFFKKFLELKKQQVAPPVVNEPAEDFDFDDMVEVNIVDIDAEFINACRLALQR